MSAFHGAWVSKVARKLAKSFQIAGFRLEMTLRKPVSGRLDNNNRF
jgi:hypothetical protein